MWIDASRHGMKGDGAKQVLSQALPTASKHVEVSPVSPVAPVGPVAPVPPLLPA